MLPSTHRFFRRLPGIGASAVALPLAFQSLVACSSSDQSGKSAATDGDASTLAAGGVGGGAGGQSSGSSGAGAGGGVKGGVSSGGGPGAASDSGAAGSGASGATDGGGDTGPCSSLTMRADAYAFELRIVNTSEYYKVDFPPDLMPHCVDQRNSTGVTDPALLETKCEASYLFKKTAGTAPTSAVTESFDVVIPFVPAGGLDLTIAKGAKGSTQYELRGLDGKTWLAFDGTQKTVHVTREQMTKGGLSARLPETAVVGPKRGAYLFPWYGSPTGPAGKWVHWDPNAPTLYTPAKGLYDSADPSVIAQQMSEAHSAGLDLLVVSYWDGEKPPMAAYLDAASSVGIEISAMLETSTRGTGTPRQSVLDQLTVLGSFGAHPAWLKANGNPIVFVYDRVTSEIDAAPVGATGWDDWAWVAAQLGAKTPIVMFPLLSQWATKGATLFGGAFAFAANSGGGNLYTGSHGDDWAWAWTAAEAGAVLAIPILPSIGRLRTDADEPNYRNQWHAARSVLPNMIIVNSWNEYHESTIIEPTTAFGTHYLDLTREEGALYCQGELGALTK